MRGAFVHGQRGDLLVGLPTVVAVVRFAGRVDHMVFVEAGVFSEALLTARHCAHVGFLSCSSTKQARQWDAVSRAVQCF